MLSEIEFFKRLETRLTKTFNITPSSHKKGEKFEELVREISFPKDYYTLIHRSSNYKQNKDDFAEETLNPDVR